MGLFVIHLRYFKKTLNLYNNLLLKLYYGAYYNANGEYMQHCKLY